MPDRPHLATLVRDMERLGTQVAVVEHRGVRTFRTSYAALAQGASWLAAELGRRQIQPGERVVLWGQNSAAWIACFFGCVLRGVLVVPLDAAGTCGFAERILRETAPRLIVGDLHLLRSLPQRPAELDLAEVEQAIRHGLAMPDPAPAPSLGLDTPLQILFTSGTTGEPKGIVHTHRNLLASLSPIEREIVKYRRYERLVHPLHFLHTLPLSHVFGQFMGLWIAPVLGAVVHYESRLEAGRLLRLLRQERISVLAAVPRVVQLLRAELLAAHPDLLQRLDAAKQLPVARRWLRLRGIHRELGYRFWAIVCGGATLPQTLESFWTTLGIALIQGYGMTETSALVTLNHPFKPAQGTLGAPLPGRELHISEQGELLVRGEMVASLRWQNGALQESAATGDGWLATGDLTRRDEQGRLHYLGRTGQRLVTSSGLNVYLDDVEAALTSQPGIHAAVAVAIEGSDGPAPGAVIRAAAANIASRAVASANGGLAGHQRITRWWLWPELDLPRAATGKVRRHLVEAWVRDRLQEESEELESAPSSGSSPLRMPDEKSSADPFQTPLHDPLLRLIAGVIGHEQHAAERLPASERGELPLESLGLDSLGRVQLQAALEHASGRSISDAAIASVRTLGELRRLADAVPADQVRNPLDQPETPQHPDLAQEGTRARDQEAIPPDGKLRLVTTKARNESSPSYDREETFLYLRWPWAAPAHLLRALFLEGVVRPLVWLLAAPRVYYAAADKPGETARQALKRQQPLLLVANHISAYDLPLLLYALPSPLRRKIATAAAGEMLEAWRHGRGTLFGPVIFWLLTVLFNVFPLPRTHAFRRAFQHAGAALDRGLSVLVFPEGARSHGGPMRPFQGGIALLAQAAAVPVLPIALDQSRRRREHKWDALRPFRATVRIGKPVTISAMDDARLVTAQLEEALRNLLAQ